MTPSLKLYTHGAKENFHANKTLIAAQYAGVKVDLVTLHMGKDNQTPEFLAKNPSGKVPLLETEQGCLFESNAIARYVARLCPDTRLMGYSYHEGGEIEQWIEFCGQEIERPMIVWLGPLFGYFPYHEQSTQQAKTTMKRAFGVLEQHLALKTFMVGERLTLADIVLATTLVASFRMVLDTEFRKPFANLTRWFETCVNQAEFKAVLGDVVLCSKAMAVGEKLPETFAPKAAAAAPKKAGAATPAAAAAAADGEPKEMSKAALKKLAKEKAAAEKKAAKAVELSKKADADAEKKRAEASKYKITEDKSLPAAKQIKIRDCGENVGSRVKVFAWVHRFRFQGHKLLFLVLRDGTGFLQTVLNGEMAQILEAVEITSEASVCIYGKLVADKRAEGGFEVQADYWELVGKSNSDCHLIQEGTNPDIMMNQRHLVIRGTQASSFLKMRSITLQSFREFLFDKGFYEITPPTLVQTSVEGGSTLFKLNYFGEEAFLTQSSQLYLETCIPAVGDCFCVMPSYRAEKSHTRRHLSEYTHLEGELPFINFDDLLNHLEELICETVKRACYKGKHILKYLNKSLFTEDGEVDESKLPKRPFKRMLYSDAIKYCNEHNIYKDEEKKEHFAYGDDIPEAPERRMTDMIGEPILLCKFPTEMKAFYMKRCPENPALTESVDVLIPGVGEIVGASMRMTGMDELMDGYKREGIGAESYYWYTDQRKYGTQEHGGYGLGVERFLMWLCDLDHIRDACLYPRMQDRCKP